MPRKTRSVSSARQADALLNAFLRSESIEDYIKLRARFPEERTGLLRKRYGVFDFAVHLESEVKKHGLSIRAIMGVLDGDPEDTDALCLQLLNSIAERKKMEAEGARMFRGEPKLCPRR